jgi:catechol 2,3-dioxygenase-like lactoylglutathione lyase family enzyme
MADDSSRLVSHVSIGTNDFNRAVGFYDKVMLTLGCLRIMQVPGAVAYGKAQPEFWVQTPLDGTPASVGNGTHIGFVAADRNAVHAFYETALAAGGKDAGAPGPRPEYGAPYYGCFVRDPDGNKVEAVFWDQSREA